MRIPKEARQALFDYLDENPTLTQDEAISFLMPHMTFDVDELKKQEAKRQVNRYMSQKRDASGVREVLAARMPDETLYVLVEKSMNANALKTAIQGLRKQNNGLLKTMRKATKRLDIVMQQLTFADMQNRDVDDLQ